MASVAFHHQQQWREHGRVRLFGPLRRRDAGMQSRDFIHRRRRGRGQPGSSTTQAWADLQPRHQPRPAFNDVALAVVKVNPRARRSARPGAGRDGACGLVEYIDFPDALVGKYQCFTEADLYRACAAGCDRRRCRDRRAAFALVDA